MLTHGHRTCRADAEMLVYTLTLPCSDSASAPRSHPPLLQSVACTRKAATAGSEVRQNITGTSARTSRAHPIPARAAKVQGLSVASSQRSRIVTSLLGLFLLLLQDRLTCSSRDDSRVRLPDVKFMLLVDRPSSDTSLHIQGIAKAHLRTVAAVLTFRLGTTSEAPAQTVQRLRVREVLGCDPGAPPPPIQRARPRHPQPGHCSGATINFRSTSASAGPSILFHAARATRP